MHCVAEQAVGCSTPTLSPQERQDPDGPGDVLDLDVDELSQHECMAPWWPWSSTCKDLRLRCLERRSLCSFWSHSPRPVERTFGIED